MLKKYFKRIGLRKRIILVLLCFLLHVKMNAQSAWMRLTHYPEGPKTGITQLNDELVVATTNSIWQSKDEGGSWQQLFQTTRIVTLNVYPSGLMLAGAGGKVYLSENAGIHWDSSLVRDNWEINTIVANSSGLIFVMGNSESPDSISYGAVYYSADMGKSWHLSKSSIQDKLYYEHLLIDKNNRLYLSIADYEMSGAGGLMISSDHGNNWQPVSLNFEGRNELQEQLLVSSSISVSISSNDSIFWCVTGKAGTVAVRLNLNKHIEEITQSSKWRISQVAEAWWFDKAMNQMFIASNNDRYSSSNGTESSGGTFYYSYKNGHWVRHTNNLSLNMMEFMGPQFFVQNSKGRIFMVHQFDNNIYFTDESQVNTIEEYDMAQPVLYPNPARTGEVLNLQLFSESSVEVFNVRCEKVISRNHEHGVHSLILEQRGLYLVIIRDEENTRTIKLIIE